jgi:hypothetical protein
MWDDVRCAPQGLARSPGVTAEALQIPAWEAEPQESLRPAFGEAMGVAGAALGLAGALGVGRLLARQLFEISLFDVLSFVVAVAVLALAAPAACWLPAWRAIQLDPIAALHHE